MAKTNKKAQGKEDKVLKGIEFILDRLDAQGKATDKQLSAIKEKLDSHDERFNRLESAVMETNINVKSLAVRMDKVEQKIDTAVTNHESRIRRLEEKAGV